MLRILGSEKRLCSGLTRRDMLQVGGLGALGLGLSDLLRAETAQASPAGTRGLPGFGQAKSCILMFLYGSPSQLETFDMKPNAPVEIRGEFKSIASSQPAEVRPFPMIGCMASDIPTPSAPVRSLRTNCAPIS